jgi:hypothetical protein
MAAKKIQLQEEATSEILVAYTDSESGADASDIEDKSGWSRGSSSSNNNNHKPQQKMEHRLQ